MITVNRDGAIREQQVELNPYGNESRARGVRVAEWMVGRKADVVLTRSQLEGPGPAHVFGEAGVSLRTTDQDRVATAIAAQPPPEGHGERGSG